MEITILNTKSLEDLLWILANAFVFKEIEYSLRDSGFPFNDIAADRAGTRMGELAIRNELDAKKIQVLMITVKEIDIMQVTVDLLEFMPEA
jgi:hypothetical protein